MFYYLAAMMAQFHNWRRTTPVADRQMGRQSENSIETPVNLYGYDITADSNHVMLSMFRRF